MIAARKAGQRPRRPGSGPKKTSKSTRSMRAFAAAGVSVTYHACDVSEPRGLGRTARTNPASRRPDRRHPARSRHRAILPIRSQTARRGLQTIDVKVGGAANLMTLTRRDPIRHFVGFGSISGRLGGFGQTDYSLANEMLAKLLGSLSPPAPLDQSRHLPLARLGRSRHGRAARAEGNPGRQRQPQLHAAGRGRRPSDSRVGGRRREPEVMITERSCHLSAMLCRGRRTLMPRRL